MISKAARAAMNSTHRKIRKAAFQEIAFNQEDFIPLLAKLVVFINDHPQDGQDMWDILTALRGPDAINPIREGQKQIPVLHRGGRIEPVHVEDVKLATTAVIRHAMGLKGSTNCMTYRSNPDSAAHKTMRKLLAEADETRYPIVDPHFLRHAKKAFQKLDLHWDKVNR